jgi:hypothetical protein
MECLPAIQLNFVIANTCKNIFPIFGALQFLENEDNYPACRVFYGAGRFERQGSGRR